MFQAYFQSVSRNVHGYFQGVLRILCFLTICFKGVSKKFQCVLRKFQRYFRKFQGCFKKVTAKAKGFQEGHKKVSNIFLAIFKSVSTEFLKSFQQNY